ncbi:hypothetical protein BD324DRAFT_638970 [Kockovaella imperatae]|uniref:DUF726-domain-containing protein n=1 Tax=Kockovaella imperatae TaxID=4999 RepID=A0A1Y1U7W5_9TREE|nr:hypothetical protein BD324DRAFT_638970 [Kockovaella imperatae]ORX33634.1 hypothetical protein BD324DRAFT_638970 [Kockovaella imperatae]
MLPSPRRANQPGSGSFPRIVEPVDDDDDDDDGWQDMPVVRSEDLVTGHEGDTDDPRAAPYRPPPQLLGLGDETSAAGPSNATGTHLELDADTLLTDSWRQKAALDESDYTRIRLDEDEESEQVHMRTRFLFDEDKAMTPLSQMQATKELLTEGQRIAYVGLCFLVAKRMVKDAGRGWEGQHAKAASRWTSGGTTTKGKGKGDVPVVESANLWLIKIMARLFQHMELDPAEQRMIESLLEHGVDSQDLVPALTTTHTVKNPEFDPLAKKQAEEDEKAEEFKREEEERDQPPPPPYEAPVESHPVPAPSPSPRPTMPRQNSLKPFGDDSDDDIGHVMPERTRSTSDPFSLDSPPVASSSSRRPTMLKLPSYNEDDDGGDLGNLGSPRSAQPPPASPMHLETPSKSQNSPPPTQHLSSSAEKSSKEHTISPLEADDANDVETDPTDLSKPSGLPSLPGVSTSLTNADEHVTLDIRWTVLCDLFLVLIADSVFDARSRVFLQRVAEALGFEWLDVVRFENRVTDALEIEENLEKTEQGDIIEGRRKGALRKRYAMMGAAAVGGGLIIGLSAGLLAPVIGAGLGAAFATVGITGTTGFLAGAGGAAMITTGGIVTGANIAGRGMARRTREVRTFELRPLHNNRRVSCIITVGGFMASKVDDVRLPFSVLDPVTGDVLSVLWEPEMMNEMGNALKILTSEILTQVGQQVLQATVMYGLMSALQWPMILTKLGYLIDNPWSNALDRARAAGLILADVIINRHAGVRPINLIGFSLGARVIFYALVELARAKAFGLVQDVFIFGATLTASRQTWLDVRSVVAGRFVNGYATNDWMLGYLFRATSGGLNTVAGLRPVEVTPGMENVDVTDIIFGHMSYRSCMPQLLARVGFPVTADHFDEPDDPEIDMTIQERTIVNEMDETQKKKKKILGIFPRRGGAQQSLSGTSTPHAAGGLSEPVRVAHSADDEDLPPREDNDEDDLPPREDDTGDLGVPETQTGSRDAERQRAKMEAEEAAAIRSIPKTAGFDFAAISKELGKDINVESLPDASRQEPRSPIPPQPTPPIDRAGSAPPPADFSSRAQQPYSPNVSATPSPPPLVGRSSSYMSTPLDNHDEITKSLASVTGGLSLDDLPSWERPMPRETSPWGGDKGMSSPPVRASASSIFGFNAWSGGGGGHLTTPLDNGPVSGLPLRAAPPARPHPVGLVAPASGRGYSKKEEELADGTENPW